MPPRPSERDIDTDVIRRTIDEVQARQRPPSGEHPATAECKNESRIFKLETRVDDHEKRLGQGDVGFAELRKDVGTLTEKVGELTDALKSATRWALCAAGGVAVAAIVAAVKLVPGGAP